MTPYLAHFGLREAPLSLTPDPQFFFDHPAHQAALEALLRALASGEGLIKVTGEVGTGKTLLCRKLLDALGAGYRCAYIPNPALQPNVLHLALAEELEIAVDGVPDQHRLVQSIHRRLLALVAGGDRVVVCVDEAQTLPDRSLEALRLLTNLETEKHKLLQIVLFGQPELDDKLSRSSLRQVRQRISQAVELPPLDRAGVEGYLGHRLRVAGYGAGSPFSRGALDQVHRASGGVPRLVNILANRALLLAYGQRSQIVARATVRAAATEVDCLAPLRRRRRERRLNLGVGLSASALAASMALWWNTLP